MKYKEALSYIDSFSRFPREPSLERERKILNALGNPEKELRFIHVAGTNGKGSTCAYISTVLSFAGEKCGMYSSPYIYEFTERIKIDGKNISKRKFASAVSKIKALELEDVTQFEIITAAAMLCFKKEKCDVVVLETGLGGRFDATNVISTPLCSVITSISLDHTAVLGETVLEIAYEKLGIVKPYGKTVISGLNCEEVITAASAVADNQKNSLALADVSKAKKVKIEKDGVSFEYKGISFKTGMAGSFQLENAVTAIEAVFAAYPDINKKALQNGVFNAKMPCRFEKLCDAPLVIVDGAHNENGMELLSKNVKELYKDKKVLTVIAMCNDKKYADIISKISKISDSVYVTLSENERSLETKILAQEARKYCGDVTEYSFAKKAFKAALKRAKKDKNNSLVLVCGSLYLPKAIFGTLGKIKT